VTGEARIDREEGYRLLDQLRTTLPVEFERARWMGREGHHQEELESQLRRIGASIMELRQALRAQAERQPRPPLAAAVAEQVGDIVEAAERTASGLEQKAATEARRVMEEVQSELCAARDESERLRREGRERAAGEAAAYLRRVEEASKKMLERADAADSEITGMLARLLDSGDSVIEDLEAIMASLKEIEVGRSEQRRPREAEPAGEPQREPAPAIRPGSRDGGESPPQMDSAKAG
jgi:cell division septum initiation protein DivIVA